MGQNWEDYYRIMEQTEPLSFAIWNQMAGGVKRPHANDLTLAEIDV